MMHRLFHLPTAARLPALWLFTAILLLVPARGHAADVVFPPASRIGIAPPPGFAVNPALQGYQHTEKQATILMAELPAYAFESIEKEAVAELQKAPEAKREDLQLKNGGRGFILSGRQDSPQGPVLKWTLVALVNDVTALVTAVVPEAVQEAAPDAVVRAAFATLEVRTVPADEQLAALPFTLADLGGFRIARVQPGTAAMLTDGPKDSIESGEQPLLLLSISLGQPPQPAERDAFARRLIGATPGLKDVRVVRSEPLRIGGHQGHEILVEAKDAKSGNDITAVQWLRFGSGGFLRVIGLASKEVWPSVFPRMRRVRDGIDTR